MAKLGGMGLSRRRFGQVAALGALGGGAAGCQAVVGLDPVRKILDIGNGSEPLSLDPHKCQGQWENNIVGNLFEGLTTEDVEANPVPGMATEWTTSADGLVWTFKLREALWSDGVPVTAADFEFAYRRLLDPNTLAQYASIQYPIRNAEAVKKGELPVEAVGVRALDTRTVEITLEHPAPYLPGLLKHYTAFPIPKHAVETFGAAWIKPENFVGNGAFVLRKWWSNYIVHLEKNERYHDAANVDLLHLYFYPTTNDDGAARRVQRGELGWSTSFPGLKQELLERELPGFVRTAPWLLNNYLSFNMQKKPFDDMRVRKALAMAVDREFLCNRVWKAGYIPAYSFVVPGMRDYPGGPQFAFREKPYAERVEDARRLLTEAGFGPNNPLKATLSHRNSRENPEIARAISAFWRAIAPWVDISLRGQETQIHYQDLRAKNYEIGDGGWIADFNDARNYLYLLETRTAEMNYSGFSDPTFDRLMHRSDNEPDAAIRAGLMKQAEQLMLDQAPVCPLAFGGSRNLVDPRITGWATNLEDIHRARWMKFPPAAQA